MKRAVLVSAVTLALLAGTAGVARAQSAPPPSAPPPAGIAPAPGAAPQVVQGAPAGTLRLHFHTYREKGTARVYSRQTDGRFGFVCATPCTADIPANTPLRVTYNDREDDPKDFDAGNRVGEEIAVEVKGPSVAPVIGGAIMMGVGGVSVISGILLVALSEDLDNNSRLFGTDYTKTLGYVTIGVGAALTVAGIIWFASRSSEPRIDAYPYRGERDEDDRGRDRRRRRSRAESFLEDEALAKPRDPLAPIAPAAAPLSWSVAF